jgi:hypothetical protein
MNKIFLGIQKIKIMRNSDVLFFSTLMGCLITVYLSVFTGLVLPDYFTFWWTILVPITLIKVFFPKNKITQWLDKEI